MASRFPARSLTALTVSAALIAASFVGASAASAAPGGTLSGVVETETSPGVFVGAAAAVVDVYSTHGDGQRVQQVATNADGSFTISGLQTGSYRLESYQSGCDNCSNQRLWYGNTAFEASGSIIELGAAPLGGLGIQLPLASRISGTVVNLSGVSTAIAAAAFLWNPQIGQFERRARQALVQPDGSYEIAGLAPGQYLVRFGDAADEALTSTVYWDAADYIFESAPVTVTYNEHVTGKNGSVGAGGITVDRLAGDDRFATAAAISQLGWTSSDIVFIVNGLNFPDALAAGPAAAEANAPVLLVAPGSIPAVTATELQRLAPQLIFIVGGASAVSGAVESQLGSYAPTYRLAGTDRYDTSRVVADFFFGEDTQFNRAAYIATGVNFPDALGAGPAAAQENGPLVLLYGQAAQLDSATGNLLESLDISKTVIAGGPNAVSAGIEAGLAALPSMDEVYRHNGADRYSTALKVNNFAFPLADGVFLATGSNFPDALAGTALAGKSEWQSPIFLVQPHCIPLDVLEEIASLKPAEIYLIGGTAALTAAVEDLTPC